MYILESLVQTLNTATIQESFLDCGMYPLGLNLRLELCPASRTENTDDLVRKSFDVT